MDKAQEQITHTFSVSLGEANVSMSVVEYPLDPFHSIKVADDVIGAVEQVLQRLRDYRKTVGLAPEISQTPKPKH